jgi:hypothetical protein
VEGWERWQRWARWVAVLVLVGFALPVALAWLDLPRAWRVAVAVAAVGMLAGVAAVRRRLREGSPEEGP